MDGQALTFEFKPGKIPGERPQFGFATGHSLQLGDNVSADHFAKGVAVQPDDKAHDGAKEDASEDRLFPFEAALTWSCGAGVVDLAHERSPLARLAPGEIIFSICACALSVCSHSSSMALMFCSTRMDSILSDTDERAGAGRPFLR